MSFIGNLKEAINFQFFKIIKDKLIALEDPSHKIFAADEFVDQKKKLEEFFSLTSISLAKGYWYLLDNDHCICSCWRCRLREECLSILLKQKTYLIVLATSYKVMKIPEKNTYPFFEEWKIKNDL